MGSIGKYSDKVMRAMGWPIYMHDALIYIFLLFSYSEMTEREIKRLTNELSKGLIKLKLNSMKIIIQTQVWHNYNIPVVNMEGFIGM